MFEGIMITSGKSWKQKVLTKKELEFMDRCFNKLDAAYYRAHKNGKCPIKVAGASIPFFKQQIKQNKNYGCEKHIDLGTGTVEHFPNGWCI
jgi:hypothetical protein